MRLNLRIFKDEELKEELKLDKIRLGEFEVGETKEVTLYLFNDDDKGTLTDLKFIINNEEIAVLESPNEIKPREIKPLVLQVKPSMEIDDYLETSIQIKAIKKLIPLGYYEDN
jgi:hypothetical protein